jgi:hypothetical protein
MVARRYASLAIFSTRGSSNLGNYRSFTPVATADTQAYAFRMPWYPKAIFSIVAIATLALIVVRPLRDWALRMDIRWLVAVHLTRFVGFYFLYLYAQHELPYAFAVRGGIGDIIVATLACALLFFAHSKPALIVWNILGTIDILDVVITVAGSESTAPGSMHQLDHFPLILLPTFIVPLIIVTHGLIFVRTLRPRAESLIA